MPEVIEDLELSEIISSGPPIEPIPHVETLDPTISPIAPILYRPEYATSMAYLRALMAACEYSQRSLRLTEYIIALNPAHYTVWTFRYDCICHLAAPAPSSTTTAGSKDEGLVAELSFVEEMARESSKNYQLWHHRELIYRTLFSSAKDAEAVKQEDAATTASIDSTEVMSEAQVAHEKEFLGSMLAEDAKNYHVWCFRQWLVKRSARFREGEAAYTESLIRQDPFNNSAWNHRFFVLFEPSVPRTAAGDRAVTETTAALAEREIAWAKAQIERQPDNQSAWSYFTGLFTLLAGPDEGRRRRLQRLDDELAWIAYFDALPALKVRLGIYERRAEVGAVEAKADARNVLSILKERDPIRSAYWDYRESRLA